ncbi:PREDICTED: m7GpppX diphosphatase [Polistes dominula]|uniref:m7GpppX diphosphatase n=1 Tax=Polistes dominula TaxID=743375 RepID=A0ABM1IZN3_POLDO|nr:PREDICTED: m7GpppX diphosphatase [Polistes dominula]XP_015185670.1 PREDICTED: m7GpppX diphosphatase [Polistes dominula]
MADQCVDTDEGDCSPAKKLKLDVEDTTEKNDDMHEAEINLSTFEMKRILQNNITRKQIYIEGTFKGSESPAILSLEKTTFPTDEIFLKEGFFNEDTTMQKVFSNHIYGNYKCFPVKKYNGLKVLLIHPATSKHIEKFKKKDLHIVDETYELYEKITLPHITSQQFSLEWIDNILAHKAEQDKIVYEDTNKETGFIIVHDLKWDGQPQSLKLLALPFQKVRSMRELNASHLPLLRNIRDSGTACISEKYNIPSTQLRIYLHYQPSYYYLHVHFSYLMFENSGVHIYRAHLLSTVINNLELMPDYYTKCILSFLVFEGDELCTKFREHGIVGKKKSESEET